MKNNRFVWLTLTPIFAFMIIFLVAPVFYGLCISFLNYNPLRAENSFVGLGNFAKLLTDEVFIKALFNTFYFVIVTCTLNIMITLVLAQLITILPWKPLKGFFRMLFFLPCVAPMVGASLVWSGSMFSMRNGLINQFLSKFNAAPVNWLGDPNIVMISLVIFTLWADIGYNTVLFSAGLDSIPAEFGESAKIDGAGPVRRFIHITFPLLGRVFTFVSIMTLISHFQMFVQFMVLANRGGPNNASTVLTLYVYKLGFINKDMGYASVVAFVLFLLIMIVTLIQRRLSRVDWGY